MHTEPTSPSALSPFRVLALDGGGIRGYYTARLLAGLLKHFEIRTSRTNLDLGKGFDLIAGTSTGSILAGALAIGRRPDAIATLYKDKGPAIFAEQFPELGMNVSSAVWAYRHRARPTASHETLRMELTTELGPTTLADVWQDRRIGLIIPTISIANYGPKTFKTPHLPEYTHDRNVQLVDACLASSAAPLFFPLHAIGQKHGYFCNDYFVDGGLWANNPSIVALIEAVHVLTQRQENRAIELYSFGTCGATGDNAHLKASPEGGLQTWNAGLEIMELALACSAKSASNMTDYLAKTLSLRGTSVIAHRFPDPEMTDEQHACLGLDKADAPAFELMEQLAATNEGRILSEMNDPKNIPHASLAEVFNNLPQL